MKKNIVTIGLVIALMASVFAFAGCGEKNPLEGTWANSSYVYTFNNDGTGVYDVAGTKMNFTYETEDGVISIQYEGQSAPLELNYKVGEKKLVITDSFGTEVEYEKQ